jgi:hypothetical protein
MGAVLYVRLEARHTDGRPPVLLQEIAIEHVWREPEEDGAYNVKVSHSTVIRKEFRGWTNPATPDRHEVWRRGRILRFHRRQPPVALLVAALRAAGITDLTPRSS